MLFPKKRYTLFIGKDRIDPGLVVLDDEPVFYADEAFTYTRETFAQVLADIGRIAKGKKARIVLCEELVYVTELRLSAETELTRERIRQEAEASVPEDLQTTDWDFQAMRYASKPGINGDVAVQIAVIQSVFSQMLREALPGSGLSIESVVPESYAIALLEPSPLELSIIAAQSGPVALLAAIHDGFVVASETKRTFTAQDIDAFAVFSERKSGMPVVRLVCSGIDAVSSAAYTSENRSLNPLIGAALEEKISGNDEAVLNLVIGSSASRGISRFIPWNPLP
jgi:hypothetical protein